MLPPTQPPNGVNPTNFNVTTTPLRPQLDPGDIQHPSMQSFASHAARNPLQPIIAPNQRLAQPVDRVSRHAARVIRQQQQENFLQDLVEFQAAQSKTIGDLAVKYHRKPQYMKKVLTGQTHYKQKRATNLYNAKIAYKRRELQQAGKSPLKLCELQQAVQADVSLQDLTTERRDELLQMLEAERSVKKTGA